MLRGQCPRSDYGAVTAPTRKQSLRSSAKWWKKQSRSTTKTVSLCPRQRLVAIREQNAECRITLCCGGRSPAAAAEHHGQPSSAYETSLRAPPARDRGCSTGEVLPVWRAARRYADAQVPVVILAGERYGTGSSRDWAAKGAQMLGARAVVANSFERIHRANLVGMGVLPLRLPVGWRASGMRITPRDTIELDLDFETLTPRCDVRLVLRRADSDDVVEGIATALVETGLEVALLRVGGMIPMILQRALASDRSPG